MAARPDDRGELVSAIKQAAQSSGLDWAHLRPPSPAPTPGEVVRGSPPHEKRLRTSGMRTRTATTPYSSSSRGGSTETQISRTVYPCGSATSPARLDGGLWFNPLWYIRVDSAPEDILPFLGANRHTFGGVLLWAVMERAASDLNHRTPPEELNQDPCFRRSMDHCNALRDVSYIFIRAMAKARLEYRDHGFISAEYASAADSDSYAAMKRMVREDYARSGRDTSLWLSPKAVEGRVRAWLGGDDTLLREALQCADATPMNKSLKAAIATLVDNSVCFGDGPRFSAQVVDETVSRWVAEMTRRP